MEKILNFFGKETKRQIEVRGKINGLIRYGSEEDLPLFVALCQEYRSCLDKCIYQDISPFYMAMCHVIAPTEFALNIWRLGVDVRSWSGEGEHIFGSVQSPEFMPILLDSFSKGASPNAERYWGLGDTMSLIDDASQCFNYKAIEVICSQSAFKFSSHIFPITFWVTAGSRLYSKKLLNKRRPHLIDPLAQENTLKTLVDHGLDLKVGGVKTLLGKDLKGNITEEKRKLLLKYGYPANEL